MPRGFSFSVKPLLFRNLKHNIMKKFMYEKFLDSIPVVLFFAVLMESASPRLGCCVVSVISGG